MTSVGTERRTRVLFLCTHNSARSQMAEAILRHLAGDRVEVSSAGTVATRIHPLAAAVMTEDGLDFHGQRSKHVDELAGQQFDYVVTVCDNARESCPVFPGAPEHLHWSIPDPSAVEGDEPVKLAAFRSAAEEPHDPHPASRGRPRPLARRLMSDLTSRPGGEDREIDQPTA